MAVIYHWKHGWIPLDHIAALSKAKGNHKLAAKYLKAAASSSAGINSKSDTYSAARRMSEVDARNKASAQQQLRDGIKKFGVKTEAEKPPVEAKLREWTPSRGGQTRHYVTNVDEILDLEVDRYKNGGVRSASLNGKSISNAEALRLIGIKAWVGVDDKKLHLEFAGPRPRIITEQEIIEALRKSLQTYK